VINAFAFDCFGSIVVLFVIRKYFRCTPALATVVRKCP
jgi:hypothetical protein